MLSGVVLCGGQSSRMGTDKSKLLLNGKSLEDLASSKLEPFCDKVYFSINSTQNDLSYKNSLLDLYENQGPLAGIISSFYYLEAPLLVLAVDMPLVTKNTIENLIKQRDKTKHVTAFFDEEKQLWQGTLAIWEHSCYSFLQTYFDKGGRSIQQFLHQINANKVGVVNHLDFGNVNTQKDFEKL